MQAGEVVVGNRRHAAPVDVLVATNELDVGLLEQRRPEDVVPLRVSEHQLLVDRGQDVVYVDVLPTCQGVEPEVKGPVVLAPFETLPARHDLVEHFGVGRQVGDGPDDPAVADDALYDVIAARPAFGVEQGFFANLVRPQPLDREISVFVVFVFPLAEVGKW